MKKLLLALCILCGAEISNTAPALATPLVQEIQVEVKNAHKGMFSVITYDQENNILHSGYGFFIDEEGTGVAAFSLFKDAYKADIVDFSGNKVPVHRILGADSNYDLVKFSTLGAKKIEAFAIASDPHTATGNTLQIVRYSGKKKSKPEKTNITKVDIFDGYNYFEIDAKNSETLFGCPLIDAEGNAVAILQKNVEAYAENAYAIDARFIKKLEISNTSILNADLNDIHISKGIPPTEKGALTYIYMLSTKDSTTAIHAINDFIESYPNNAEGFTQRGALYAQHNDYANCEADFEKAMEVVEENQSTIKADEIHNNLSKIIYNKVVFNPQTVYEAWTLDRAIEEAQQAFELNPSPYYLLQQAHCYLAKKDFLKASEYYQKINTERFAHQAEWSDKAKAESWIYAVRAFDMYVQTDKAGGTRQDSLQIVALLDSAIAALPQPYIFEDAKIFFERGQRLEVLKEYRKAVMDYNEYEKIIGPKKLNDKFYYLREQAELKAHMYQQALDDINTAIAFNPNAPLYPTEKALVLLQVGMYKEAIAVCQSSLETLPENPDCYKIMGICYGELKNKKEALKLLQKAQDLGDPTVQVFIDKYK